MPAVNTRLISYQSKKFLSNYQSFQKRESTPSVPRIIFARNQFTYSDKIITYLTNKGVQTSIIIH